MAQTPLQRVALAGAGGAMALGQAPWGLWPVTVLALAAVMLSLPPRDRGRAAFSDGWALGFGYFLVAMHWIVAPFQVDVERHGWMAPFALVLMAGGLALFWGLAALPLRWLARGPDRIAPFALAATLALAELARSLLASGLPWALIGHSLVDSPFAQLAAGIGPHGLTLAVTGMAAALAIGMHGLSAQQFGPALAGLLALPLAAVLWPFLDPGPVPPPDPTAPIIRIVQPNVAQADKWNPDLVETHIARLITLTAQAPSGNAPALVVWPETAVPYLQEWAEPVLTAATRAAGDSILITGINRREGERYFNTLLALQGQSIPFATVDKSHLAPFGEYIPAGDLLARFGIQGLASGDGGGFTAGTGLQQIDLPGIGRILPLICYEGIFAEEVARAARGARALVLITNDAWFGQNAGPAQHLAQARLRAIEQGMPLIRAANTGISALIDAQGRVVAQLPLGQAGVIDHPLPPLRGITPYQRLGDAPALIAMLAILALCAGLRRRPIDPEARAT